MTSARPSPLFWQPDNEFARVSEWDMPKAFAFGDMDILEEHDLSKISDNYFRCAELLVDSIFRNEIEDFVAQFPVIYLYRHAFELRLKHIIRAADPNADFAREHRLHALLNRIDELEPWAQRRLQELGEIDPKSDRLRYGGVGTTAKSFLATDVRFFRDAMRELQDYLTTFCPPQDRGRT